MIKKLKITNFQSHKNTTLNFDKGVNMIIGSSDCGKTAVIRALQWALWNRPGGDSFRSNWGGKTSVELTTVENDVITRIKDKSDNLYTCNEQIYRAFGTDIPEDIKKKLNINSINCQAQLDSPFLLTETPGEVAKQFNKIAHLEQIDKSLQNVEKWLRSIKRDSESNEKREKELNIELISFKHLQKFEIDIEVLEKDEKRLIEKRNKLRKLRILKNELLIISKQLEEKSKILQLEIPVNNILALFSKKEEINKQQIKLIRLIKQGKELRENYKKNKRIIRAENLINNILNLFAKKKEIKQNQIKLIQLIERGNKLDVQYESNKKIIAAEKSINIILNLYNSKKEKMKTLRILKDFVIKIKYIDVKKEIYINDYKELKDKFKNNFPDVCPLCGQIKPKQL